jgi:hypothetical protein
MVFGPLLNGSTNGTAGFEAEGSDFLSAYTPDAIIHRVNQEELATTDLRQRFDDDLDRVNLKEFTGLKQEDKGYKHYTSNAPRTYMKKLLSWIVAAEQIISVENVGEQVEQRQYNDAKERFAIGVLRHTDDQMQRLLLPSLRSQMGTQAAARGYVFTRALLRKEQDGSTALDVKVFDARNTVWAMGATGLLWVCHKVRRTRREILDAYGIDIGADTGSYPGTVIYDYYDGFLNVVVREGGEYLKPPQPHFAPRIPIAASISGYMPLLTSGGVADTQDISRVGESIFDDSRGIMDSSNFLMSVLLELASRQRNPPVKIRSRDGSKTLEGDPHEAGAEMSLSTANEEDVEDMPFVETTRDLAQLLALVSGEMQRATLPHIVYGEAPFSLSGVAMQSLRQGIESQLLPVINAVQGNLLQVINLIADQYTTGFYEPLSLSGYAQNRNYFSEQFNPAIISIGGDYTLELVPQLPEDDMQKMSMAQIAREAPAGVPLFPDSYIHENILAIQDSDDLHNTILEQMAETASPMAQIYTIYSALMQQGRQDLAQIYLGEAMVLMMQQAMMTGMAQPPPIGQHPGSAGKPDKAPAQAASAQAQGLQVPTFAQGGPNRPAGAPRPGAQAPETQRLNQIGLLGPGQ